VAAEAERKRQCCRGRVVSCAQHRTETAATTPGTARKCSGCTPGEGIPRALCAATGAKRRRQWRRGMGATLVCGWQHSSCYNSGDCTNNRRGDISKAAAPPQELSAPTLANRARRPGRRACSASEPINVCVNGPLLKPPLRGGQKLLTWASRLMCADQSADCICEQVRCGWKANPLL